jgi:ribonucleotide monophosphatase NagD (HAD superfamily)
MKTQRKIFLNSRLPLGLLLFLLAVPPSAEAQTQTKVGSGLVGSASLIEDKNNVIASFSPVFNSGKTYVRWLVKNDEKDGVFVIERSRDGVDFEALGFKDRVGSPLCVNLFYSFIDEAPEKGINYYRLMAVGTDQSYSYSDVVRVRTEIQSSNPATNSVMTEPEK